MVFGKHINRYYLRYAHMLLLGLAALVMVDYLQLVIPELYQMVINGINDGSVLLDGQRPIEAVVRKTEAGITLASADSGACRTFTDIKELQDSSNPYDPFALHKAALIACGVVLFVFILIINLCFSALKRREA